MTLYILPPLPLEYIPYSLYLTYVTWFYGKKTINDQRWNLNGSQASYQPWRSIRLNIQSYILIICKPHTRNTTCSFPLPKYITQPLEALTLRSVVISFTWLVTQLKLILYVNDRECIPQGKHRWSLNYAPTGQETVGQETGCSSAILLYSLVASNDRQRQLFSL